MLPLSQYTIRQFQQKILAWYSQNKRDLPWRRTRNPYRILISEVMLQQTQVSRVIPKYEAWLKQFPTVEALASASTRDVLALWSGLGYNRRALNLQKAAKAIVEDYSSSPSTSFRVNESRKNVISRSYATRGPMGFLANARNDMQARTIKFPNTIEELKKLPGVGEYTARAIVCFAFDEQIAVVDTNVRRVILTQFQISNFKFQMDNAKQIQKIADQLLPRGRARDWNQALMDYSAMVLKKEKVPTPKQSPFKGSNRYYRGKLLRLLLAKKSLPVVSIGKLLRDDFAKEQEIWLSALILQMEREGFVRVLGKNVSILS